MPIATASRPALTAAFRCAPAAVLAAVIVAWAPADMHADKAADAPAAGKHEKEVDAAIDKALAYLAGRQLADGSFPCPLRGNTGATSLCVMAFLAKGYTPGAGPYGGTIDRGIDYVLKCQHVNGLLVAGVGKTHEQMYSHGISTLMLSEVSGMVAPQRQEKIDKALPKALKLILVAQRARKRATDQGGWRYRYDSPDSDISCTAWQLMALRSARNNGAPVPKQAVDEAVRYILSLRLADGGFG